VPEAAVDGNLDCGRLNTIATKELGKRNGPIRGRFPGEAVFPGGFRLTADDKSRLDTYFPVTGAFQKVGNVADHIHAVRFHLI